MLSIDMISLDQFFLYRDQMEQVAMLAIMDSDSDGDEIAYAAILELEDLSKEVIPPKRFHPEDYTPQWFIEKTR